MSEFFRFAGDHPVLTVILFWLIGLTLVRVIQAVRGIRR